MVALDAVDALSDDDAHMEARPDPKAKPKAKGKTPKSPKKTELKAKATPKKKPKMPKATPKKRPAAALSDPSGPASPTMKKPAAKGKPGKPKDPEHISTCKSKYKSNGVWSIKLFSKEVIRVSRLIGSLTCNVLESHCR